MKYFALLILLSSAAFGVCTPGVTSPTAGQNVSGRVNLSASFTTCPSMYDAVYIVDGVVQATAYAQQAYQIPNWNSNNRHNGLTHFALVRAYDATGTLLAESSPVYFSIDNSATYGEPRSYVGASAITFTTASGTSSTPPSSAYGVIGATVTLSGTALGTVAGPIQQTFLDGDYTVGLGYPLGATGSNLENFSLDTSRFLDGNHTACFELRDSGTNGSGNPNPVFYNGQINFGYPYEEDCIYFSTHNQVTAQLLGNLSAHDTSGSVLSTYTTPTTANIPAGTFTRICAAATGGATGITLSDSVSDTPTYEGSIQVVGANAVRCAHFSTAGGSAISFTMSMTGESAATNPIISVEWWQGVSGVESVVQSTGTTGTGVYSQASSAVTTTTANDVLDGFYWMTPPATYVQPIGWKLNSQIYGSGHGSATESQQVVGTVTGATQTISTTGALSAFPYAFTIAVLQPSGSLTTAPARVTISPREWSITDTGTQQLTPGILNADGTSSALPAGMQVTYSTGSASSLATISSTGLVTPNATGFGAFDFNVTLGNGFTKSFPNYGYIRSTNAVYHLEKNGTIGTTASTNDVWASIMFNAAGNNAFLDPSHTKDQFGIPYSLVFNTLEVGAFPTPPGDTQSTFSSNLTAIVNTATGNAAPYGLYLKLLDTSLWQGSPQYLHYAGNPQNIYTSDPFLQAAQAWKNTGRVLYMSGPDESDDPYSTPVGEGRMGQPRGPTQIVDSAGSCTITYDQTGLPYQGIPYSGPFIITGATVHPELNNTLGGAFYTATSQTSTTLTFACPNETFSADTDPGITVQYLYQDWLTIGGFANQYVPYNAGSLLSSDFRTGGILNSGEVKAYAGNYATWSWQSTQAGYADFSQSYSSPGMQANYAAQYYPLVDLRSYKGTALRSIQGVLLTPEMQTDGNSLGTPLDYILGNQAGSGTTSGQIATITSINGPVVNFSAPICGPTLIRQSCTTYAGVSRGTISGSSIINGNVMVETLPTSSSAYITWVAPQSPPSVASPSGTITMADGTVFTGVTMDATLATGCGAFACTMTASNAAAINVHWGQTFTFSAAGADPYYSKTFYLVSCIQAGVPSGSGASQYCNSSQLFWREVVSGTSAGGTMLLILDQEFHRGQTMDGTGNVQGPVAPGAEAWYAAVIGEGAQETYQLGENFNEAVSVHIVNPCFNNGSNLCTQFGGLAFQPGVSPLEDQGDSNARGGFYGIAPEDRLLSMLASTGYLFGAEAGAPDAGYETESSLRSGPLGKLLLVTNPQDVSLPLTLDISTCNTNGGTLYTVGTFGVEASTFNSGATTLNVTVPAGGGLAGLCPTGANPFTPVTFSAKLSDVANAASIVVQYDVTPFHLQQTEYPQWGPPPGTSIGTGSGTVNLDLAMGPWFYRYVYLNASGTALATGAIQCLGGTTAACPAGY